MTEHRLDPLLKPTSIALVGASERDGSPGQVLARMVMESDYPGVIYPVNPGYPKILGQRCYPSIESLPQTVEHVVIAIGNVHLQAALHATIKHGARAATIYSSGVLQGDVEPPLKQRLASMAKAAALHICGINGMGFYNPELSLYAGIFQRPNDVNRGGISFIAQSGSAFTALCHNGCRLGFNLCASVGNELTTTVADYMDWSLDQPDTRVIGLFLETVRNPAAFVAALEKARQRDIPVVVLKIGKSPLAASMAVTHTGAIAGSEAAFGALCKRHAVIEVDDFDEMAAILMLLQGGRTIAAGGFAAVFESGGLCEHVADMAATLGLEFAALETDTLQTIQQHLEPGLKAENPLDLWGSQDRFEARFEACLIALMSDANVAAGAFFSNFRDGYFLSEAIYRVVEKVSRETDKPLVLATCYSDLANSALCRRGYADGVAMLDGTRPALLAFRHLFSWRDCLAEPNVTVEVPAFDNELVRTWKQRLIEHSGDTPGEAEALAMLSDFSIPVVQHKTIASESELVDAAAQIGYPVVLKTAQAGINHKSDCAGVFVDIAGEAELRRHYLDINARLGPDTLLSAMVPAGVEIALGTVDDPQFGPLLMVAAGGTLVELLADRACALCPVSAVQADAMLGSLKADKLLRGMRGRPAVQRPALIEAMVKLSRLAYELRDSISEIDVNPIIVSEDTAVAVDALVLCKTVDA